MSHKIRILILTFCLFAQMFFFSYNMISGRLYASDSYLTFTMIIDVIPLLFFIWYLSSKYSKRKVGGIIVVLATILIILLLEGKYHYVLFRSFIAYSIPSALIGIMIAKFNGGPFLAKLLEPFMLFLTFTAFTGLSLGLASASLLDVSTEQGMGMQSLSYYTAFAFSLNLYYLLFGDEIEDRFAYTKLSIYKYFCIAMLVLQVVVSLSSGGRGGFVLLVVSAVLLVFIKLLRRKSSVNNGRTFLTFLLVFIAAVVSVQFMPDEIREVIDVGSERTFSYLSKGGIDMSNTSNRDDVYAGAINDLKASPVFGYGLLMRGTSVEGSHPHNIVLEVLLQGGIIYLVVFVAFFLSVLRRLKYLIKRGHKLFIIPVFLYPIVMLFFSGSYLATGLFWFCITYIISYEFPIAQRMNQL